MAKKTAPALWLLTDEEYTVIQLITQKDAIKLMCKADGIDHTSAIKDLKESRKTGESIGVADNMLSLYPVPTEPEPLADSFLTDRGLLDPDQAAWS